MKRMLMFKEKEDKFVLEENTEEIFEIHKADLKFDSLSFYTNVFKNFSGYNNIEFSKDESCLAKNATYIYSWISEIIENICTALNEGVEPLIDESEMIINTPVRLIKLYSLSACAGDGIYAEGADIDYDDIETQNSDADYAVKISGQSMEPDILDGDVVLVKETEELLEGDIGIFNVDGDAMCKIYTKKNKLAVLVPINEEFNSIEVNEHVTCRIQGKVLETI